MRPLFKLFAPLLIISSMLLSGCGSSLPSVKPFKMDIQQGNVVTSKMLLQLKPGMTKSQVRFIMGTPLVVDSFHKDRWDYFYQMRQAGKIIEQRRVILDFEKELLTKVRGDVVPQGTAGAEAAESIAAATPITVEPKPQETTLLDKLKFWKKDEKPITKTVEVDAPLVAPVTVAAAVVEAIPTAGMAEKATEKTMSEKVAADKNVAEKSAEEKSWADKLKFWKKDEQSVTNAKSVEADAPLVASTGTAAAEIKDTAAKVDMTNESTAKSASDKSLLDKLEFWKKDAPIATVEKAVLAADTVTAAASGRPTSVMNTPIELPGAESAPTEAAEIIDPLKAESQKTAPLRTEPFEATKKPSITGKDSMKPLQSPSQKMLPGKPELLKLMPEKPAVPSSVFNKQPLEKPTAPESQLSRPLKPLPLSAKKGEQLIFRMDKTLDMERGMAIKLPAMPDAVAPATDLPKSSTKDSKLEQEPLSPESEPSFFDKMLEKIGF
jgi:outer membrane protein assembly factor BamE